VAFWTAAGFIVVSSVVFGWLFTMEPVPDHVAAPADD
jgi:hypothetical protein